MPRYSKAYYIEREIIDTYKKKIDPLEQRLREYQEKCRHERAVQDYGSDTGNYDPSADCYWSNIFCPTCLKLWRVSSEDSEYTAYTKVNNVREYHKQIFDLPFWDSND